MRSRWRTACFSLILLGMVLIVCEALLSIAYFHQSSSGASALSVYGRKLLQAGYSRLAPIRIYEEDPILGYRHQADAQGKHRTLDFSVTYTLDGSGGRLIQQPEQPVGQILFVGGSYTFGHGVEDSETFSSILAGEAWAKWGLVNRAVSGYGTAHAYLVLEEAFKGQDPPDVVIYPLLNGHIIRNYINAVWIDALSTYGRRHPHFEIEEEQLAYQGVVGMDKARPESEEVTAMEHRLTRVLIQEMERLCEKNGAVFYLVLLPGERWPPSIVASLYQLKNPPIDLSQLRLQGFDFDGHPNAADNRNIAERIEQSPITELLRAREREWSQSAE